MQEIEMKFRLQNIEEFKQKLVDKGCNLSAKLTQKDTIFVKDLHNTVSEEGKIYIRIRKVNGVTELNLKKQSKDLIQSKEIEFKVEDYDKVYDFLSTIDFKEWVTVEKTRLNTTYNEINICIDTVKHLGDFVEFEIITEDNNDIKIYEEKILQVAREFNVDVTDRVNSHYDTMISELNTKD